MHEQIDNDERVTIPHFEKILRENSVSVTAQSIDTLQVNVTYLCNQACVHCHVAASPHRTEMMDNAALEAVIEILAAHEHIRTLDLTGGAPELHPRFDWIVERTRELGKHVIVRHNLTVTLDGHPVTGESKEYLPGFFARNGVELVSSLPYYQQYFTDKQRGKGVFEKSIRVLKMLNAEGYGDPETGLVLNLVYNPVGAFLPAEQGSLCSDYKKELTSKFGITFNNLFTITNMPIFRFREQLRRLGTLNDYFQKLVSSFNPNAAEAVMCRNQISVGYDGRLYDCDFNQMLGLQIVCDQPMTVFNFEHEKLLKRNIIVAPHCFGCTAGSGSSCGGVTAG